MFGPSTSVTVAAVIGVDAVGAVSEIVPEIVNEPGWSIVVGVGRLGEALPPQETAGTNVTTSNNRRIFASAISRASHSQPAQADAHSLLLNA
jgi:hypothetical protein